MKTFAYLALLGLVSTHHRCDDLSTGETNALAGPLYKALQKAKESRDLAIELKEEFDLSLSGTLGSKTKANEALKNA